MQKETFPSLILECFILFEEMQDFYIFKSLNQQNINDRIYLFMEYIQHVVKTGICGKWFGSLKPTRSLLHVKLLWSQLIMPLENTKTDCGKNTA